MNLEFFLQWHNVPLMIALVVGVGMVAIDLLTGAAGVSVDVDADFDLDIDADVDGWDVFGLLGLGRVPIAILVEMLLLSFACYGLLTSAVIFDVWPSVGPWLTPIIYGNAVIGALATTRVAGGFIASWLPGSEADSHAGIYVGELATAVATITPTSGEVKLADHDIYMEARCLQRDPEAAASYRIKRGTEVRLVSYLPASGWFYVTPAGD